MNTFIRRNAESERNENEKKKQTNKQTNKTTCKYKIQSTQSLIIPSFLSCTYSFKVLLSLLERDAFISIHQ